MTFHIFNWNTKNDPKQQNDRDVEALHLQLAAFACKMLLAKNKCTDFSYTHSLSGGLRKNKTKHVAADKQTIKQKRGKKRNEY